MPLKFFITHSWKDIAFAKKLCDDLHANGMDGFFDAYSIQPGDDIPARIAKGLEECDNYVPILSPAALKSRWSELEINAAITQNRNYGRPRIIPVIAEKCDIPILLRPTLYISFVGWSNENVYRSALNDLLSKCFGIAPKLSHLPLPLHPQSAPASIPQPKPSTATRNLLPTVISGIFIVMFLSGAISIGAWMVGNAAATQSMPTASMSPIARIPTQTPWIVYVPAPAGWVSGTPLSMTLPAPIPASTYGPMTPTPWMIYVPVTVTPKR